jgi:hypothetical protein
MQIVFVSEPYLIEHYSHYGNKADRDFIMEAISINADILKFIDTSFRNDIEIVKLAVSQKGELLKLASDALKNNRDVVSLALNNNPYALSLASDNLKKDEEFLGLFYDYMLTEDPHSFINYEAALELFILLPENPMRKRTFDKRVGYFANGYDVFEEDSQKADTDIFAVRWRLEPKNEEDAQKQKNREVLCFAFSQFYFT